MVTKVEQKSSGSTSPSKDKIKKISIRVENFLQLLKQEHNVEWLASSTDQWTPVGRRSWSANTISWFLGLRNSQDTSINRDDLNPCKHDKSCPYSTIMPEDKQWADVAWAEVATFDLDENEMITNVRVYGWQPWAFTQPVAKVWNDLMKGQ